MDTRGIAIMLFAFSFLARAGGGSIVYKGFVNEPLGQAALAVDGNGHLIVSNIGSSGQDGVRVPFGSTPFEWELALPAATAGPDGAFVEFTSVGMVDGNLGQEILTLRIVDVGNLYELRVDTSALQTGSLSVSTQHQDVVPDFADYVPPPGAAQTVARFADGNLRIGSALVGAVTVFQMLRFDTPVVVELPDGSLGPHVATQLSLATVGGPHVAGFTDTFELRAAGLDPLVIEDEDAVPDCLDALTYCTAKTSSAGCSASMATDPEASCNPVSGAGDFSALAQGVQGFKNGILFFGFNGAAALPFSGGTLCMLPPLGRGPVMNAGGSHPLACDGAFALVINDGGPWDPGSGQTTWMQSWIRDPLNGPGNLGTALSNAIRFDFL